MNKYEISIYRSSEDGCYIAVVPELPGCMADGETQEEALKNVNTIISEWIETARQLGREIPKPREKTCTHKIWGVANEVYQVQKRDSGGECVLQFLRKKAERDEIEDSQKTARDGYDFERYEVQKAVDSTRSRDEIRQKTAVYRELCDTSGGTAGT